MSLAVSVATHPDPRVTRRLAIGLFLSLAAHLAFVLGFAPSTPRFPTPAPFEVEIRHVAAPRPAEATRELSAEQPSPSEMTARPVETELPPAAPSREKSPPAVAPSAPLELPLPLDRYFPPHEVDIRAEPVNEVHLVYPEQAYMKRIRGRVVLRIFINDQGTIDDVSVLESTPPGVFEEAALTATLALQFKPAIRNGRSVKSYKTIEVVFDPYESIHIP
jgi:protein TonB